MKTTRVKEKTCCILSYEKENKLKNTACQVLNNISSVKNKQDITRSKNKHLILGIKRTFKLKREIDNTVPKTNTKNPIDNKHKFKVLLTSSSWVLFDSHLGIMSQKYRLNILHYIEN